MGPSRHCCPSLEALGAEHGGELGSQHLQADLAVVLEVFGEIDRGHAALAQLPVDPVAVRQGYAQAVGLI